MVQKYINSFLKNPAVEAVHKPHQRTIVLSESVPNF